MTQTLKTDISVREIRANNLTNSYAKKDCIPGVYCWGYYVEATFIPLYVGKSRNVHERLLQHYCRFRSGEYRLFDPRDMEDIYIHKNYKSPALIYEPLGFSSVINDFPKIKDSFQHMVENFTFRYVEIKDEEDRMDAERALADKVGRERLITSVAKSSSAEINRLNNAIFKILS